MVLPVCWDRVSEISLVRERAEVTDPMADVAELRTGSGTEVTDDDSEVRESADDTTSVTLARSDTAVDEPEVDTELTDGDEVPGDEVPEAWVPVEVAPVAPEDASEPVTSGKIPVMDVASDDD